MKNTIIFKVVEAWGAMTYVDPDTQEELYVEGESHLQEYWVVKYDTEEHEVMDWLETFPTKEQAEEYKQKLEEE